MKSTQNLKTQIVAINSTAFEDRKVEDRQISFATRCQSNLDFGRRINIDN